MGRSSFALAQRAREVIGIDFSTRFVQVAARLQEKLRFPYAITEEGELQSHHWVDLAALGLAEQAGRCQFVQGDACNLKPIYRDLDLVLAANLIDRLSDPAKFLRDIAERIRPGGLLVLSSPYTWLEEFTPKERWIGGLRVNGESRDTLTGLKEILAAHFDLHADFPRDLPFVIRETARKYQHSIAQVSVWRRR
ncbi:putative 4-mercaptohistidine N1-methyltransferase [Acidithiobacillus sp. AMEEHan]|uniref:putative 4-mercaptohistidine N1-methyltransferase n=1 Tax=Acidithiobacillus sp. AMEEHan TaxID=2994951 RepID=UPI0035AF6298